MNRIFASYRSIIAVVIALLISYCNNVSFGQIQNPYWIFNGNYLDVNNGSVLSLPTPYITKSASINGLFNPSGTLNFYLSGSDLRDRNGNLFSNYTAHVFYERVIIPKPNSCNVFYVPIWNSTLCIPCSGLNLELLEFSFNPSTGNITQNYFNTIYLNEYRYFSTGFAVSPSRVVSGTPTTHFYTAGNLLTDEVNGIYTTVIYDYSFTSLGYSAGNILTTIPGENGSMITSELELSHDGNLLAWGTHVSTGSAKLYVYNLSTSQLYSTTVSGTTIIDGVEFSATNDRLFFTKEGGDISYASIASTGSIGTISSVGSSSGLGTSQIELASDGYMYVSNGTSLRKFDPYEVTPTMNGTSITVSNPAIYGRYTLIDQIDGSDYKQPFRSYGCEISKLFNNTTSLSSSTNSWFIKTINTAQVASGTTVNFTAGDFIELNPGFLVTANSTTNFNAIISACYQDVIPSCVSKEGTFDNSNYSVPVETVESVILSPNPTEGIFEIKLSDAISDIKDIGIYDALGNKILTVEKNNLSSIDLSDYETGVYLIKVTLLNKIITKKLIRR